MYVPKRTNKKGHGSGSRDKSKETMDKSIGQGESGYMEAKAKNSNMKEYNLMVSSTQKTKAALATVQSKERMPRKMKKSLKNKSNSPKGSSRG